MPRRRFGLGGDALHISGRHRSFPIAARELSPEDILARYGGVLVEGLGQFAADPGYLSEVVLSANRIEKRRGIE